MHDHGKDLSRDHARSERIPIWGLFSAIAAPVLMIGGWTLAARLQHGGFDSISDTISALAGRAADHRWVMTSALAGLGVAHVISALAMRPAAIAGRVLLAAGGVATVVVAAAPLPAGHGSSQLHGLAAGVAFVCLTAWPALSTFSAAPAGAVVHSPFQYAWPWRRPAGLAVTGLLLVALGWFFLQLTGDGGQIGLSERVVAAGQALWPLVAVVVTRNSARQRV